VSDESGAELEARGRASHAAGDYQGALARYEEAYAALRRDGELMAAARAARTVGWFRGWVFGDWAVSRGWSARARSLLERAGGDGRALGWLLLDQAASGNDLESQRRLYLDAVAAARRCGDRDLECEATASLGMMLVFSGYVPEGMAHLDDALAAICGGEVDELPVLEGCLCGMLHACERTHDVVRAEQWLRAADELVQRRNLVAVAGYCRAHYGGILVAAGRWPDAEAELAAALDLLPLGYAVRATALCRLADLRVRQGRFEEAAELLVGLDHHEDAVRPLAALHLARGEPGLALELLDRVLASRSFEDHVEAPLVALVVDAQLARGALDEARRASARLTDLARDQSAQYLKALAAVARGRVCVATGEGDARACWHQAMSMFATAKMPVDVARTRLDLARVLVAGRPAVAAAEATAALEAFEWLGATRDADDAAALLRSLGASGRPGPRREAELTKREDEVLALLGHGLTNVEIGERLYISAKTVEHHASRIYAKLGVRSRAEAAARAVRGAPRSGQR